MLSRLLGMVGARARPYLEQSPWGSGLGLARSLLALGTAATLLATPTRVLLSPLAGGITPPFCDGAASYSTWCVVRSGHGEAARWLSIAILLIVASGWRPRITALAHWWVSWSFIAAVTIQDGGDQITSVLTLLLVPVALTDRRRWHWQPDDPQRRASPGLRTIVAYAAILLMQLQVAVLYFQAAVAKFGVTEWADGTAMYYWFNHPTFGAASWLRPVTNLIDGSSVAVAAVTWGSIGLELALAAAIVLRRPARRVLLAAGLVFHEMIALCMGLVSFDIAMSAALLLYLLPIGHMLPAPRWWIRLAAAWRRRGLSGRVQVAEPTQQLA
jgi:antimicrobial peptide system SdpB family protein